MTSKEKVIKAIQHQEIAQVAKYIWYHSEVEKWLARKLGLREQEDLGIQLGNDVLQPWLSINKQMAKDLEQEQVFVDEWGISWKRDGYYSMVVDHPLNRSSWEEIRDYSLPDPLTSERYLELKQLIEVYGEHTFVGADVSGSVFEPASHLRNAEELLIDMALSNREMHILFDRLAEFTETVAVEALKCGADWIWLGDDIGTQKGMMISPDMWRKHLKPRLRRIIRGIRDYDENAVIVYHSCGSIRPVIKDLIEIGIDALNPIQPTAQDMDPFQIKEEYGDEITLICGLDTQEFIIKSSPIQVKEQTECVIEKLSVGGGFVFAVSHTLQPDVPLENILAMLQVLERYQ